MKPSVTLPRSALKVEVGRYSSEHWAGICQEFRDANVYQSQPYGIARVGADHLEHLLLKDGPMVLGACQVRISRPTPLPFGIAFVRWGPLLARSSAPVDPQIFREFVRALRTEYVGRRRLVLRIAPRLFAHDGADYQRILEGEGFTPQRAIRPDRTILMDIRAPVDELYRGLHQKWRYNLNKARKQNLELIQGTDDSFFTAFEGIYDEMVDRKRLHESGELAHFRNAQRTLVPAEKLHVILCRLDGTPCAGAVGSTIGDTGIYLFGATSNRGIKTFGSYLVHWTMLDHVKRKPCRHYDLNGINPEENPGGYQFKNQLSGAFGQEVRFLGQYDAYPTHFAKLLVTGSELFRKTNRKFSQWLISMSH